MIKQAGLCHCCCLEEDTPCCLCLPSFTSKLVTSELFENMERYFYYFYFSLLVHWFVADCPMTTCNHADASRERSCKSPVHSLISPRFLKSQPAPGHANSSRELDRRLIQSQPASHSASARFVTSLIRVVHNNII